MMKRIGKKITAYALGIGLLGGSLAACSQEETVLENAPEKGSFVFTVNPPELKGMNTRALFPLGPEMENPIKNLAMLVFDKEGTHLIENKNYYLFHQIADDKNPDGQLQVKIDAYKGSLDKKDTVTLCAVANVNQEKLIDGLKKNANGSTISLKKFKELFITLPYYDNPDSVGLVKNIYMFGYHYGPLAPDTLEHINIAMGRIITRLNISLSVSEELATMSEMKYAIRMLKTQRTTHVFPAEKSPTEGVEDDKFFYQTKLTTTPKTFYYYVGPHYAEKKEEATQIEIAYGTDLPTENVFSTEEYPEGKTVSVAICNDPPSVPAEKRDFRINRNCVYNIDIYLKKKGETQNRTRNGESEPWVIELDI